MTFENTTMTKKQFELAKRLVVLGDSESLAIETALAHVEYSDEMYQIAYYS